MKTKRGNINTEMTNDITAIAKKLTRKEKESYKRIKKIITDKEKKARNEENQRQQKYNLKKSLKKTKPSRLEVRKHLLFNNLKNLLPEK